jgi:hypothetical protein
MTLRRALVGVVVAVAIVVGLAGVASAGDPTSFKVAKHADGPFTSDDVRLNLAQGSKKPLYIKVRGGELGDELVELSQSVDPPDGYKTRYFKRNGTNITGAVKGGGFEFEAKVDEAKRFRVNVRREQGSPAEGCFSIRIDEAELIQVISIGLNHDQACDFP